MGLGTCCLLLSPTLPAMSYYSRPEEMSAWHLSPEIQLEEQVITNAREKDGCQEAALFFKFQISFFSPGVGGCQRQRGAGVGSKRLIWGGLELVRKAKPWERAEDAVISSIP